MFWNYAPGTSGLSIYLGSIVWNKYPGRNCLWHWQIFLKLWNAPPRYVGEVVGQKSSKTIDSVKSHASKIPEKRARYNRSRRQVQRKLATDSKLSALWIRITIALGPQLQGRDLFSRSRKTILRRYLHSRSPSTKNDHVPKIMPWKYVVPYADNWMAASRTLLI
jgi:hypothetical protein